MRHGYHARLAFSESGNLIGFGTGSDACAEHEIGSELMQQAMSSAFDSDDSIITALKAGQQVVYPSTADRKRIHKNLDRIEFIEISGRTPDEPPQAILGFWEGGETLAAFKRELEFCEGSDADKDVSGAWDESSFAIRVRGEKYVKALREFHAAMKGGRVLFAGTFLECGVPLSGVVLADMRYLPEEARKAMADADAKFVSAIRLRATADAPKLLAEMQELARVSVGDIGYLWAVWGDKDESQIRYVINPSYSMRKHLGNYHGPYTREQLLAWARTEFKGELCRPAD